MNLLPHDCFECNSFEKEELCCNNLENCEWLRTSQSLESSEPKEHPFFIQIDRKEDGTIMFNHNLCQRDCLDWETDVKENPCNKCFLIKSGFEEIKK